MKEPKDLKSDDRSTLQIWQSVDTWADHLAVWEKKGKPYVNQWEMVSLGSSAPDIVGYPHWHKRKCLGRTPRRWIERILFFLVFYVCLVVLSITLFYIFKYGFLSKDHPMYTDFISGGRGISKMLKGNRDLREGNSREYARSENQDVDKFFSYYSGDISTLGRCAEADTPCFFIRPNRIVGWEPEKYESLDDLPANAPTSLEQAFISADDRSGAWLTCEGSAHKDKENIISMTYYPSQLFSSSSFPFKQQKDYADPLIGVEVALRHKANVQIRCKIWAKNIKQDKDVGSITFVFSA